MYTAVVLAGGENTGGAVPEALLRINEKPMLAYVLQALESSRLVRDVVVAGPQALQEVCFAAGAVWVEGGAKVMETLAAGIRRAGFPETVLIVTADIPFLTGAIVDDFLADCTPGADFYYPVIEKQSMRARFPGAARTYVRLREGRFTGGNLFLVKTEILPRCQSAARKIADNRKKPWRLAAMLGWANLLKFACGHLSLEQAREAAQRLLEIKGRVVCSPHAEIGMDVDKAEDLELARKFFKQGGDAAIR